MFKIRILGPLMLILLLSACAPGESDETQGTQPETTAAVTEQTSADPETQQTTQTETSETAYEMEALDPQSLTFVDAFANQSFQQPVQFQHAGDGSDRVYVVEQPGFIWMLENDPQTENRRLFLDLSETVDASASEKGLLGLAFHPDFGENGQFYVNYTDQNDTVIARYQATVTDEPQADVTSEAVLLRFEQPYDNHNGGHIAFGPDGYLYIATGDGGGGGDPDENSQDLSNLHGALLRIDVDGQDDALPYAIPADNPFIDNEEGYRQEIFAYGLRNPWRFSFDAKREWLWAADVGQNRIEEINLIEKGGNYGWNHMEGSLCYPEGAECDDSGLILPVWEYEHPIGRSITGGYAYYGEAIPPLHGAYVYADFVSGRVWALWLDDAQQPQNELLMETEFRPSAFGLDASGELYLVDYHGKIYRLQGP